MHNSRISLLNSHTFDSSKKSVVYWVNREFRAEDNWSLNFAQKIALENNHQLIVLINLLEEKKIDYVKPFNFFIEGLFELKSTLEILNIPVNICYGKSKIEIPIFLSKVNASALVTDFFPLKYYNYIINELNLKLSIPFYEIDSHNIVPCKIASPKKEFAAYTFRPKIKRYLDDFLIEIPKPIYHKYNNNCTFELCNSNFDLLQIDGFYNPNNSTKLVESGKNSAFSNLNDFISLKLDKYKDNRNNPNLDGISGLSPFIHFGQISSQRIALEILKLNSYNENKVAFIEELIIRKELADNFCFYNTNYDSFEGFHTWAKITLDNHRKDKRDFNYSKEQFEYSLTHDMAWNSAQNEMKQTGKMHGYMRMYWAKKILEWTQSPEEALEFGIYLNDKYSLDGYDPNGYVGLAWSIGGVHDRAWFERPIFGKIRNMNFNGLKKKFDINKYIEKWN